MQRQPVRRKIERGRPAVAIQAVPPPIGGWNARDPLSAMPPSDAIKLDNVTPLDGGIELRPGSGDHASGLSGLFVESLMDYSSPTTRKLFAAATDTIWDVTSSGAAASSLTSLTNGRWQHCMFVNAGNSYLMCVNDSADGLRYYNGSGWSTATLTGGIDQTALANICSHMNRIWLCEDGSLDVWYLGTGAVTGDATKLTTSTQFSKGGKVMAMASWTRDGGAGMDDVLAIISSMGEVLIYSGTDPASASTWVKVGLFSVPPPIDRRSAIKYGGDIAILTRQGLIAMSEVLQRANATQASVAITDKIRGAFAEAADLHGSKFGWQVLEYPRRSMLIINVPTVERESAVQFVMNTKTGAWARWTDLHTGVWHMSGNTLYFGTHAGAVQAFDTGFEDDGAPIDGICVQAYNTFGDPREKVFRQFKPQMIKPQSYKPVVDVLIDFDPVIPSYTPSIAVSSGWEWDVTEWDDLIWGDTNLASFDWLPIRGNGTAGALVVVFSADSRVQYNGGLVRYEAGE